MAYTFEPIGIVHSCFTEKFGTPRQPGLIPEATATLELLPPYDREEALRGIEGFSHAWIVFVFHACLEQGWSTTVRPPRLGGNQRVGVFATRSNFRPNPIGLSVVELDGFRREKNKLLLRLKGVDLLDETPVLDIKPYVPYADCVPEASGGFAPEIPERIPVKFTHEARWGCEKLKAMEPGIEALIEGVLGFDHRPAYRKMRPDSRFYTTRVANVDIKWRFEENHVLVMAVLEPSRTQDQEQQR